MEQSVVEAWEANAHEWARAVRQGLIPSRTQNTNRAILQAMECCSGETALDLGCGEGWLSREMSGMGWQVTGVDSSQELILQARALGREEYHCLSYEEMSGRFSAASFDLVVANFSLLGEHSTEAALMATRILLKKTGRFWVQTLASEPGWQTETWESLGGLDCKASPWFGRTLEDWQKIFTATGFEILKQEMPVPENPASLLFNLIAN